MNNNNRPPRPENRPLTPAEQAAARRRAARSKERRRRKRRRQRILLLTAFLLCAVLLAVAAFAMGKNLAGDSKDPGSSSLPVATPEPTPTPTPEPVVTTVKVSATGDNLIHDALYKQANRRAGGSGFDTAMGYDFGALYEHVAPFYKDYDVNWLNQETLVTDELEPSNYPCFSTPGDLGRHMYDLGFRVFSLSNNHTYDKGSAGIAATRRFWDAMPDDCLTTGLVSNDEDDSAITLQTVNGVTIAYLSYTDHTNGIPQPSDAEAHVILSSQTDVIQRQVSRAAELADFVLVGMHWGIENSHTISDSQRAMAQQLADWGADVVIGTHPHVVQDMQWLTSADGRQVLVAYSLGNFVSAQSVGDNLIGMTMTFDLTKTQNPDGTIETAVSNGKAHPTVTHYDSGYADITCYFFKDYTEELANRHGVRSNTPAFSYEYIRSVLESNISPEFLDLTA